MYFSHPSLALGPLLILLSRFSSLTSVGWVALLPTSSKSCRSERKLTISPNPRERSNQDDNREKKSSHILVCHCNSSCALRQGKTILPPRCVKCNNIQKTRSGGDVSAGRCETTPAGAYNKLLLLLGLCNQNV